MKTRNRQRRRGAERRHAISWYIWTYLSLINSLMPIEHWNFYTVNIYWKKKKIKKQGLLKWWNEQNISARDSRAELSCEGRVGSTLACLGTSWRKSRVQYDCKHSSEVVGGRKGGQWDTKVQQSSSQEHWLSAAMPQGCRALLGGGDRGRRELMRSRRRWRRSWSKRRRRWRRRRWEEEEGGCCSCIVGASPPPRSSPTPPHLHSNNFLFNSLPFLFPLIIWQQGFFGIKTPLSISFWL